MADMNSNRGSFINAGQYLETGDYLTYDYGAGAKAFCIMQGDGNFCWYKGTGPADNHGVIWSASSEQDDGDYFLMMETSGDLMVYRGTGPSDPKATPIWHTDTAQSAAPASCGLALAIWSKDPGLNPQGYPTIGIFTSDPYTTINAKALWYQQKGWSL